MEHRGDGDTKCNWCTPRKSEDKKSIDETGQNTKKNPGNLRRLAVTQTSVKDHQQMLLWKILKEVKW